jgi:hypothetical protein
MTAMADLQYWQIKKSEAAPLIGLDTIQRLECIDYLSHTALNLLDTIWMRGVDHQFNATIDKLLLTIAEYQQVEDSVAATPLMHHCRKLSTYQTIFNIDIDKNLKNGLITQMAHAHVVDAWKIILLQICNDLQRIIITYLWDKKRKLGRYIEQLQYTFTHKNRCLHEQRSIVTMLGKRIISKKAEPVSVIPATDVLEPGYEIVPPNNHSIFGYWFSG